MFGTQNAFLFRDDLLNGGSVFRPAHKKKKKTLLYLQYGFDE